MSDKFYVEPWHIKCSKHDKPVTHIIKSHKGGELYRRACSERCAAAQRDELEVSWGAAKVDPR